MHANCVRRSRAGITLVEVLCATAVLMIVMAVLIARFNISAGVARAQCAHNLKETALAFRLFASDNDHRFPMQVPASLGGAREASTRGELAGVLQALSQERLSPQHLVCPTDARTAAGTLGKLSETNISYFVGLEARHDRPASVLLGDRDLGRAGTLGADGNWLTGVQSMGSNARPIQWTGRMHRDTGNLAFADGSVRPAMVDDLTEAGRALFPK